MIVTVEGRMKALCPNTLCKEGAGEPDCELCEGDGTYEAYVLPTEIEVDIRQPTP